MEVRSSSHHRRMPIKSRGRKESPIDRRRLAFFFLALARRFSFSCSFSFPFTLPTRVAEATEAKGCPNWEVGIMGRINMQGLDTCGGRRWRRRRSRKRMGQGLQEGGEATKGVEGEVWMERKGLSVFCLRQPDVEIACSVIRPLSVFARVSLVLSARISSPPHSPYRIHG